MQNLIQELEQPRVNANNETISPSNLNRRAANAIKQLLLVKQTDALVIQTLQKEIAWLQEELENAKRDFPSNVSSDESGKGTESQGDCTNSAVSEQRIEVSGG